MKDGCRDNRAKGNEEKSKGDKKLKKIDFPGMEIKTVAPVIISASTRTDIPAFFSDWFISRWKKGKFLSVNRFGLKEYILNKNARVVVFWTKNPAPLLNRIDDLNALGVNYYYQYTLNDYDEEGLEPNVPPLKDRVKTFIDLSKKIGKNRVVWRFDPLMLTKNIDAEKLIQKVYSLADQIAGYTESLVVSLANLNKHKNVKRKLENAGIRDFSEGEIEFVAKKLVEVGKTFTIDVVACRDEGLTKYGISPNKCIDDDLMKRVFSQDKKLMAFLGDGTGLKNKGQIKTCGCIVSKDIGHFNTCQHFCVYCYANASDSVVKTKIGKAIEKGSLFMIPDRLELR